MRQLAGAIPRVGISAQGQWACAGSVVVPRVGHGHAQKITVQRTGGHNTTYRNTLHSIQKGRGLVCGTQGHVQYTPVPRACAQADVCSIGAAAHVGCTTQITMPRTLLLPPRQCWPGAMPIACGQSFVSSKAVSCRSAQGRSVQMRPCGR